jgi:soluble lytic murein transglycosylase-like protein
MPATAKAYGLDPTDPLQNAMGAARLDAELLKRYRGDLTEALAAYNWNPTGVDAQAYISKFGLRQNGADINIYNNAGGSAVVTASGLAH